MMTGQQKNKKQSLTDQSKRLLFIHFVKTTLDVLNPDACKTPVFTVNRNVLNHVALSLQTIQPVIKSDSLFLKQRLLSLYHSRKFPDGKGNSLLTAARTKAVGRQRQGWKDAGLIVSG